MSPKHKIARAAKSNTTSEVLPSVSTVIAVRLILASILFVCSVILKIPAFLSIILLVVSAVAAGYDIALKAYSAILRGEFTADPVIVVLVSVLAFFVGFSIEGAALVILYQIGLLLLNYAKERSQRAALELLHYQDDDTVSQMKETLSDDSRKAMPVFNLMYRSSARVLKLAMIIAVVYAIVLPLFTSLPYSVSIHRALIILLVSSPLSVVASIPSVAEVGLCYCAQQGIMFSNAAALEGMADVSAVAFDKNGVFADETPRVTAVYSDVFDSNTFMNFVAHSVYYSDQPIARAVAAVYDHEYNTSVIKDFSDIPGYGVQLSISGIDVVFATRELFDIRGIELPPETITSGQVYYMVVAGKLMGKVVVSSGSNRIDDDFIPELRKCGINRCILFADGPKELNQQFAEDMGFSELYADCDEDVRLGLLQDISNKIKGKLLFIHSGKIDYHTDADIDIRVGRNDEYSDAAVSHDSLSNISFSKQVALRVRELCIENSVFAFVVKSILIFLAITGYCNLWFAIFIDFVAAVATVLNSIRVTSESLLKSLKYKMGR